MKRTKGCFKTKFEAIKEFFSSIFSFKCLSSNSKHTIFNDEFLTEEEKVLSTTILDEEIDPLSLCWQIIENAEYSIKTIQNDLEKLESGFKYLDEAHDPEKTFEYNVDLSTRRNKVITHSLMKKEELLKYLQAKNFAIMLVSRYAKSLKKPSAKKIERTLKKAIGKKYRYKTKYDIGYDIVKKEKETKIVEVISLKKPPVIINKRLNIEVNKINKEIIKEIKATNQLKESKCDSGVDL